MCTNFSLFNKSANADYVITARTMDFSIDLNAKVTVTPRNQSFPQQVPAKSPLKWKNQYGYVSMQCDVGSISRAGDGINEKGLSVGMLWLADAVYQEANSANAKKTAIYNIDVADWILGNFDSVPAVKEALNKVTVISSSPLTNNLDILVHYVVTDSESNSLIIEYTSVGLQIYDSDNGVMTNTPPYPWHLNNLVNFLPLSLENSPKKMWGGQVNGSGLLGMPGDYVPTNRFIRAWYLQQSTTQYSPKNVGEAIGLAARILQSCAMPIGSTKITDLPRDEQLEYTQFGVIRDHKNLTYSFFTQFNHNLFTVDLKKIDFKNKFYAIPSKQPQWNIDITDALLGTEQAKAPKYDWYMGYKLKK